MGYTTEFKGNFTITPKLNLNQIKYLNDFCYSRRMKRNIKDFGENGEYYIGKGERGQNEEKNIIDYNEPPITQPSLWCDWVVNEEGTSLSWNESEKFYNYVEWLSYLINNFFGKNYLLNSSVKFQGEAFDDKGEIVIINNVIKVIEAESGVETIIKPEYVINDFMFK